MAPSIRPRDASPAAAKEVLMHRWWARPQGGVPVPTTSEKVWPANTFSPLLFEWNVFKLKERQAFQGPNLDAKPKRLFPWCLSSICSFFSWGSWSSTLWMHEQGPDWVREHAGKPWSQWCEDYCRCWGPVLHRWLHASHGLHGQENKGGGTHQMAEEGCWCCCDDCCCAFQPPSHGMFGARIWPL